MQKSHIYILVVSVILIILGVMAFVVLRPGLQKSEEIIPPLVRSNTVATTTSVNQDCVSTDLDNSVTILNDNWAIKGNFVYGINFQDYDKKIGKLFCVLGASSNTFKILGSIYAEDGNNIYRFDYDPYNGNSAKILEDADRDSFTVINDFFAKDKKKVYFSGYSGYSDFADSALSASDPRYFEVLSNRYAKDNSSVYVVICYEGCVIDKIDANPNTFRVINDIYTADKDRVYCYGKNGDGIPKIVVVEGVNLSTFISDPSIKWNIDYGKGPDAYDKYNQYKKCKKYVPGY